MSETPLLDWLPAHQSHSPTSRAAAEEIKMHVGPMHADILKYLWAWGNDGRTDEEMQLGIPMRENTQRPRRRELQNANLIVKSGTTRATKSGRQAVVWVLADIPANQKYKP